MLASWDYCSHMHFKAKQRMHELSLQVLDGLEMGSSDLNTSGTHAALRPLTKFVEENFEQWVDPFFAFIDAFVSVENAVNSLEISAPPGPLRDALSADQRQLAAERVVEFWDAVPKTYEFIFPLPAFPLFGNDIEIAPGLKLKNVAQSMVDGATMGVGVPLNTLAGGPQPLMACLEVSGKGLMIFANAADPAAASAIRRAKVVLQLGEVEDVFTLSETKFRPPHHIDHVPNDSTHAVVLPAALAGALARLTATPSEVQPQATLADRLPVVGLILSREGQWDPTASKKAKSPVEAAQAELDRHCARIATAAEWLFDATHDQASATTFVQTAIGFEALYGGAKGEPVIETLANRVAYSLGTSPQSREQTARAFTQFYDTRSTVVHSGASRLTMEQQRQLSSAQSTLKNALRHEMCLVSQGNAEIAAERGATKGN
jgi:hypothetical protein